MQHKGWYSRGYLPHLDSEGSIQFVTFRLADSLPKHVIRQTQEQRDEEDEQHLQHLEALLDAAQGACVLRNAEAADLVQTALTRFHQVRYLLFAWCVMPNHVHVLLQPQKGHRLSEILHSWKSYSAKRINSLIGRTGVLWQSESFDRYIRDDYHLEATIQYIENNPVKAGLADAPHLWPWSSASRKP